MAIARVLAMLVLVFFVSTAAGQSSPIAGTIIGINGEGEVQRAGRSNWEQARARMVLYAGDVVRTGRLGVVSMVLADESLVKLHRQSRLTLREVAPQAGWIRLRTAVRAVKAQLSSLYELSRGKIWMRNKNRSVDISVRTAYATTGIRGTEFIVELTDQQSTVVSVLEGVVETRNAYGAVPGTSGEEITATATSAPVKRVLVNPQNAVQWTLSIPDFFDPADLPLLGLDRAALENAANGSDPVLGAAALRDLGRTDDCLARSAALASAAARPELRVVQGWCMLDQGDARAALDQFGTVASANALLGRVAAQVSTWRYGAAVAEIERAMQRFPEDARFAVQAALLSLLEGRHDRAEAQLAALVETRPDDAAAWRYRALNAVIVDDIELAARAASEAIRLAPDSPSSHLVSAYAHQAVFNLPAAERATRRALEIDPANTVALTNLARLQFGSARTEASVATLARARSGAPSNAEVLVLTGYTAMAERRSEDARKAFEGALTQDAGKADAWLGLGLLAMRSGDVAAGLEAVTAAVALDPQRALYMSYWGKMLYQIRRFDKAIDVFIRAEQLDPRDPTPAFYRAIALRDLNRPGEAIRALNRARALNDNRAVYRSRFLLDRDLAARNVDLSVVYAHLGLEAWSRLRAINAIKADYRNYSAHLALAGTLSRRPERAFPFANEQLLARLLQPATINAFNTFNDYTSLFEQSSVSGIGRVRVGSFDRLDGDVIAFGNLADQNIAFQLGAFRDSENGWRDSNGTRSTSLATIVKWQPTERDGLMFAVDALDTISRDEQQRRFEASGPADPRERLGIEQTRIELGYHRRVAPQTDLIAYLTYMDQDIEQRDQGATAFDIPPFAAVEIEQLEDIEADQPLYQAQIQLMHQHGTHQLIAGALALTRPRDLLNVARTDLTLRVPVFDFETTTSQTVSTARDGNERFYSAYVHDIWRVLDSLTVDGAVYFDRLESESAALDTRWELDQFNPRIGLAWQPRTGDTLRLAAFRYLLPFTPARTDPNDVAGISVVRNVNEGARVTEYAAQWDHEWSRGMFTLNGFRLQGARRDRIRAPGGTVMRRKQDIEQLGGEFELNYLLTDAIAFTSRYRYAVVEDESDPPAVIFLENVLPELDRVEQTLFSGIRFLFSNRLGGGFSYTRREMDMRGGRANETAELFDLDIGYELKAKRGRLDFFVRNLFDSRFDWVTDRFIVEGRTPRREFIGAVTIFF